MKWLLTLTASLTLLYALLLLVVYLAQRHLIYYPQAYQQTQYPQLRLSHGNASNGSQHDDAIIEVICVNTDAQCLPKPDSKQVLFYFGGNAEVVVDSAPMLADLTEQTAIYLMNYRGYGGSSGRPSEQALIADAVLVYDTLRSTLDAALDHPVRVSVVGRSLGTGVAMGLASQRAVDKLALITPFDSLQAVASRQFPVFPVSWLLKDRYLSTSYAKALSADTEVMLLIAGNDGIIAPSHSHELGKAFAFTVASYSIQDADHNDIMHYPEVQRLLQDFLSLSLLSQPLHTEDDDARSSTSDTTTGTTPDITQADTQSL